MLTKDSTINPLRGNMSEHSARLWDEVLQQVRQPRGDPEHAADEAADHMDCATEVLIAGLTAILRYVKLTSRPADAVAMVAETHTEFFVSAWKQACEAAFSGDVPSLRMALTALPTAIRQIMDRLAQDLSVWHDLGTFQPVTVDSSRKRRAAP